MKTIYKLSMTNCIPCKQYEPIFNKVKDTFHAVENVEFYSTSVDEDFGAHLASTYKIRSAPATLVFEGEEFQRVKMGVLTEQQLVDFITQDDRC